MNESRSTRYHRARRRAGGAALAVTLALLAGLLVTGGSASLRDAVGGSVAGYVGLLALAHAVLTLPAAWYRGHLLERQYELSQVSGAAWLRDHVKGSLLVLPLCILAAELVYRTMRVAPVWWPAIAAAGATAASLALTVVAPLWILPLFHRMRPLGREPLRDRLVELSARAGVRVLGVYEWALGAKTRRASAALVGAGWTRRILLSDTLLADYADDEIEVILAHEMGHHAHRDVLKGLAAELAVLLVCLAAGAVALRLWWAPLGLTSPADVAGLPLLVLAAGAVSFALTPALNALSRHNERCADRFALELTAGQDAFVGAMRRMAAQNLAEEHPSRAVYWLFHTHPTVEERIAASQLERDDSSARNPRRRRAEQRA